MSAWAITSRYGEFPSGRVARDAIPLHLLERQGFDFVTAKLLAFRSSESAARRSFGLRKVHRGNNYCVSWGSLRVCAVEKARTKLPFASLARDMLYGVRRLSGVQRKPEPRVRFESL